MYSNGGFDIFWNIFPVLFGIAFVFVICLIVVTAVRGMRQWSKNNASPVVPAPARVVTKRVDVSHHHDGGMNTEHHHSVSTYSTYSSYYVTFEFTSGDRMVLAVPSSEYGLMAEGDEGVLSFQGTRFVKFERYGRTNT